METNEESSDELLSQCKSLMHEQKLAGKSFDEAFEHVCNVHGAEMPTEEEAREIWVNDETDESTIDEKHDECCECERGQYGPVISNYYEHGVGKFINKYGWYNMAKRVIDGRYIYSARRPNWSIILIDLFHENMITLVTPANSMLLKTLQHFDEFSIESIEPINHTLVVLLMKAKNSIKRALLLARIHPQELPTHDEGGPRKKARRNDESDGRIEQDGFIANRWSYTILDSHITACSNAHCYDHRLAARDTLDSIVHQTCTKYAFYGVSNEKLVFQHEILKNNVVLQGDHANDEHNDDDEEHEYKYHSYHGPHAWTVIGDTFFALNSIGASFDFDRKAYYSSECVEYSISAGKPISRKSIYLGATIKYANDCWIDGRQIDLLINVDRDEDLPYTQKAIDVRAKRCTETGHKTCLLPWNSLAGTNHELIICFCPEDANDEPMQIFRLLVKKPDSLLALAWTSARLRGANDAVWFEALMSKLPPNIEVQPWHGFF